MQDPVDLKLRYRGMPLLLLREKVSRSGGDLLDTGKVTKSVGNGACGEAITPRWHIRTFRGATRVAVSPLDALCVRGNDSKCCDLLYDQQLPIQTCVIGNSQV